jgi:hypothetical protein
VGREMAGKFSLKMPDFHVTLRGTNFEDEEKEILAVRT